MMDVVEEIVEEAVRHARDTWFTENQQRSSDVWKTFRALQEGSDISSEGVEEIKAALELAHRDAKAWIGDGGVPEGARFGEVLTVRAALRYVAGGYRALAASELDDSWLSVYRDKCSRHSALWGTVGVCVLDPVDANTVLVALDSAHGEAMGWMGSRAEGGTVYVDDYDDRDVE